MAPRRRSGTLALALVALATALVIAAGCGAEGDPTATADGTGSPPNTPESPVTTMTPEELAEASARGLPVLDREGRPRGIVTQAQLDAQDDRVRARIGDREVSQEVALAHQDLEPIEIVQDGEPVGYWTSQFVPLEEYPAVRERAEALLAEGG